MHLFDLYGLRKFRSRDRILPDKKGREVYDWLVNWIPEYSGKLKFPRRKSH